MSLFRIEFTKGPEARFLSHLDTLRLFGRALRRGDLKVVQSEGFHPHPRLTFAAALPVGVIGEAEALDLELQTEPFPAEIQATLNSFLPPGFLVRRARSLPTARSLGKELQALDYRLVPVENPTDLPERLRSLLGAAELPWERSGPKGTRRFDLRPFLVDIGLEAGELALRLLVREGRQARPEELAAILGLKAREIRRTALLGRQGDQWLPLFDLT